MIDPSLVRGRTPSKSCPRRPSVPLPFLLTLLLLTQAPCGAAEDPSAPRITSIRRVTPTTLLIEGRVPDQHYVVMESRTGPNATFRPTQVTVPPNPAAFRIGLTVPTGPTDPTAGLFRVAAIPLDAPRDADGDGMDDVYEAVRSHVLDPLDPGDASRDADGDGDSNLTEYLSRTESAPPPTDAPVSYPSLEEMRRTAPYQLPSLVHLGGYDREGDGWGGWFVWLERDTQPIDNALSVGFRSIGPGRLRRVVEAGAPVQSAWWRPPTDPEADAGPALQRAIEYMASRPVRKLVLHPGRYRVHARIVYSSPELSPLRCLGIEDFEIDGGGATIWSDSDGELLMFQDCRRGTVRNLTIQGSGSDRGMPDGNYTAIGLVGVQSDLLFERCAVKGFMHGLSHLHGEKTSMRVTIRECYFEDGTDAAHGTLGSDGAAISGIGDDWRVENCVFHECGRGVEVENTDKAGTIARVVITGNRMTQVRNLGIMAYLGGPAATAGQQSDLIVRDNIILGRQPRYIDPRGQVVPVMNIAINGGSRWLISGNICEDGDYAGISVYANQAPVEDCVISDNIVTRMGGRGIQVYTLDPHYARGVLVSGNRIRKTYGPGILLAGDHHTAQGNLIEDTATGIVLGDPGDPLLAARNLIVRGNTLLAMPADLPAIVIGPSAFQASITGNDILDARVGIRDLSTNAVFQANRFQNVEVELEQPSVVPESTPPETSR